MKTIMSFLAVFIMSSSAFAGGHTHSHDDSDHKHYTAQEIMDLSLIHI